MEWRGFGVPAKTTILEGELAIRQLVRRPWIKVGCGASAQEALRPLDKLLGRWGVALISLGPKGVAWVGSP